MHFDEAETKFGKRWDKWDDKQWDEFMGDISPHLFGLPLVIIKLCQYRDAGKLNILPEDAYKEAQKIFQFNMHPEGVYHERQNILKAAKDSGEI